MFSRVSVNHTLHEVYPSSHVLPGVGGYLWPKVPSGGRGISGTRYLPGMPSPRALGGIGEVGMFGVTTDN